jgi:hypothetical protein
MGIDASYKNDLLHIESIVATLERITRSGGSIASTSLINEPGYWRQRIETLLRRSNIAQVDREHAQALLIRLCGIVRIPSENQRTET